MSQQINLINPELRPRRDWLAFATVAPATLAVLLVVVLAAVWVRVEQSSLGAHEREVAAQLKAAQDRLQAVTKELAARTADPALANEAERLKNALSLRREALQFLQAGGAGKPSGFASAMAGLARQSTDGLWLTGFAAGGGELEIRGRMLDPALLPLYIRRLNAESAFQGRRFAELDMKGVDPQADTAKTDAAKPAQAASPSATLPRYTEFTLRTVGAAELNKLGVDK